MTKCARCGGPTKGQDVFQSEETRHRHFPDCVAHLLRSLRTVHALILRGDIDAARQIADVAYLTPGIKPATPADAEAAGKREYLRVTGQLAEDGKDERR